MRVNTDIEIYHQADRCAMPHDICVLRDGEMMIAFREATNHLSLDGSIVTLRSTGDVNAFGERQVAFPAEGKKMDFRDPSLTELSNGTLLLSFFAFDEVTRNNREDGGYVIVLRSHDHGRTWPDKVEIAPDPFHFVMTTERCIEMPDGSVLMPAQAGSRKNGIIAGTVFRSVDEGRSWSHYSTINSWPFAKTDHWWTETALEMTPSGSLIAVIRTYDHMVQSTSHDLGKTWTPIRELMFTPPETQPSLTKLKDGRLLLSYGDRGPLPRDPDYNDSIKVSVSTDAGDTWSDPIVLHEHLPHWDMGYPTTRELEDGSLFTVYWWTKPNPTRSWPDGWQYWLSGIVWRL